MKLATLGTALLAAAALVTTPAGADHHDTKAAKKGAEAKMMSAKDGMPGTIVDVAVGAGSFKTLVAAVQAAGLVETLQGEGPFTVFAPTDEAFAKLPEGTIDSLLKPENKDELVRILTYHVVPGKVMSGDVIELDTAKTVEGQTVNIATKDGKVMIDDAQVVKADVEASNGVIHVIDTVILPKDEDA